MALTLNNFCGFETGGLEELSGSAGSPTMETTIVRNGAYSVKFTSASEQLDMIADANENVSSAGTDYIHGFGLYPTGNPTTEGLIWMARTPGSDPQHCAIGRRTNGDLYVIDANGSQIGSDISSPLTNSQWNYIEIYFERADPGSIEIFVEGSSVFSSSGQDLEYDTGDNQYMFLYGLAGATHYYDDLYLLTGASAASDRLTDDVAIERAYQNTAEDATDQGTTLDQGTWADVGDTPYDEESTPAGYTGGASDGHTICDEGSRPGPSGGPSLGTIEGMKWIYSLKRGNGSGTTHTMRFGHNGDTTTYGVSLSSSAFNIYSVLLESSASQCPTSSEYSAQGFTKDGGGREIYCAEIWACIIHVAAGVPVVEGSAAIGGAGAMSATGLLQVLGAASIGGIGALSGTGLLEVLAQASIGGAGGLTATALLQILAAASIGGAGDLDATGLRMLLAQASIGGAGGLTATALRIAQGIASLGGAGDLDADALLQVLAQASIGGAGDLTADGTVISIIVEGTAAIGGTGGLSATALLQVLGAANIGGAGGLSAGSLLIIPGAATLSGTGGLSGAAILIVLGAGTIGGAGDLTADGEIVEAGVVTGTASIGGAGGLTATALLSVLAAASIGGAGGLTATALKIILASGTIGGQGDLTAGALKIIPAQASIGGAGGLSAQALVMILASGIIGGAGGLTADGEIPSVVIVTGTASIGGTGGMALKAHVLWASPSGRVIVVGIRQGASAGPGSRIVDVGEAQRSGGQ